MRARSRCVRSTQLSDAETRQQCSQIDGASWQPAQCHVAILTTSVAAAEDLSMEEVLDMAGAAVDIKDANMRVRDFGSPLYVEVHYNGATSNVGTTAQAADW